MFLNFTFSCTNNINYKKNTEVIIAGLLSDYLSCLGLDLLSYFYFIEPGQTVLLARSLLKVTATAKICA